MPRILEAHVYTHTRGSLQPISMPRLKRPVRPGLIGYSTITTTRRCSACQPGKPDRDEVSLLIAEKAEEMGDPAVSRDLVAAVHRGVQVRLVTTLDDNIGSLANTLRVVKRLRSPYVHCKAIIRDGLAMYVGSENLSTGSLDSNREMGLIVTDRSIIQQVEATFAGDVGGPVRTASSSGQALATPPSVRATTPTTTTRGGGLSVVVQVSPNPIPYGGYPTVTVRTAPAADCTIVVRYASGKGPTSYPDHSATANVSGTIVEQGQWHLESRSSGGTVTASCTSKGTTATGTFSFQIG